MHESTVNKRCYSLLPVTRPNSKLFHYLALLFHAGFSLNETCGPCHDWTSMHSVWLSINLEFIIHIVWISFPAFKGVTSPNCTPNKIIIQPGNDFIYSIAKALLVSNADPFETKTYLLHLQKRNNLPTYPHTKANQEKKCGLSSTIHTCKFSLDN